MNIRTDERRIIVVVQLNLQHLRKGNHGDLVHAVRGAILGARRRDPPPVLRQAQAGGQQRMPGTNL